MGGAPGLHTAKRNMLIRPAQREDLADIDRVIIAAFREHGTAVCQLVASLRASNLALPDLTFVAADEAEIVGFVSVSVMEVEREDGDPFAVLNLTPLAVGPGHQGRGIGAALVEAAIMTAKNRPEPLLFVEGRWGSNSLYGRYFEPRATNIAAPSEVPNEAAFQMLWLPRYDESRHYGQAKYPDAIRQMVHSETDRVSEGLTNSSAEVVG